MLSHPDVVIDVIRTARECDSGTIRSSVTRKGLPRYFALDAMAARPFSENSA